MNGSDSKHAVEGGHPWWGTDVLEVAGVGFQLHVAEVMYGKKVAGLQNVGDAVGWDAVAVEPAEEPSLSIGAKQSDSPYQAV